MSKDNLTNTQEQQDPPNGNGSGETNKFSETVETLETTTSKSKQNSDDEMMYTINDIPPWHLSIFLALQNYLTMFSSPIAATFLLAPAMCISVDNPARANITATMMLVFGIVTLLQTLIGSRLPIVQGGSFAYLIPIFTILSLPHWRCPETIKTNTTENDNKEEIWMIRMQEIQGDIAIASIVQMLIGMTGVVGFLLRWITPLVITPTIALIGLSLFSQASSLASKNWFVSIGTISLMILFSQYLRNVKVPIPYYSFNKKGWTIVSYPLFSLLPVLMSVAIMWFICYFLTLTDVFPAGEAARTDRSAHIINQAPWIRIAYPFQWGIPRASIAGVIGMTSAVIASVIESIGDYYACARLCSAPPPPVHAINRGIAIEGFGGILAGIWGAGIGSTSLSQNVGAISITKVGSRRVVQYAALMMIVFGIFTKFGAVFVTIPEPIVGGIYCVMFGIVTAVGISNVQFIDLNSSRNLFILGFSIFFGMAFPTWIAQHEGFIQTGYEMLDQILTVLLSTNMLMGGFLGFVLDNTVPGSNAERGLDGWHNLTSSSKTEYNAEEALTYNFPEAIKFIQTWSIAKHLPFCPMYGIDPHSSEHKNDDTSKSISYKVNQESDVKIV